MESIDGEGHSSFFEYDEMNRLTKVKLRRIDKIHDVDEIQETLYTYDHRGLVKTEVNAAGDGKALVYDGNGNLIQKTDEDGYVTEYEYSPVNLVSKASYADGKEATYLYDGTGDLIRMVDWVGETTFEYDLLDRLLNVNDHNDRNVNYVYDNVGNTIAIQYPDGTQADYWYDRENQMVELADPDGGLSRFEFDPNGNVIYKEYPNNETAVYSYDAWNQLIELDEYDLGGKKHFKTTYTWDAEGNRLTEMQYNHGQSGQGNSGNNGNGNGNSGNNGNGNGNNKNQIDALVAAALPNQADLFSIFSQPDTDSETDGVFSLPGIAEAAGNGNNSDTTPGNGGENTGKDDATIPGNGDGNGQVPPGQTEDDEGGIKNPAGHYPPGLNRGKKPDKPENPDKPGKPENPGTEDKSDRKAQKGEHIYKYNNNGWVTQGTVAKETTTYTYDTLGNLVQEKCKNTVIDYQYNILNQLVSRTDKNDSVSFSYDKRGNRVAEVGKKATEAYVYDATNHLVEGTNWKGDKSAYTYNGLFVRVRNTQTTHAGQVYDREFVIDYNSFERNDLMVFSAGYYEQKHIYTAWGERMEQFTERGNWDRLLYVHEDIMGNTRYYTKDNGQSFAELEYDVWGAVTSPEKLNNNDNGNFAAAVFTGHPYDTVLDIYFAEARFYDANHRQWMSVDPIKSGLNWYLYVEGNPATFFDPNGLEKYIEIKPPADIESIQVTVDAFEGSPPRSNYYDSDNNHTNPFVGISYEELTNDSEMLRKERGALYNINENWGEKINIAGKPYNQTAFPGIPQFGTSDYEQYIEDTYNWQLNVLNATYYALTGIKVNVPGLYNYNMYGAYYSGMDGYHPGVDLSMAKGTSIYALSDGIVVRKTNSHKKKYYDKDGKEVSEYYEEIACCKDIGYTDIVLRTFVATDYSVGWIDISYMHLNYYDYEVGTIVHRGQKLGTANGNYSFGSHTHLEVIPTDQTIQPYAKTPTEGMTSLPPYAFLESMLFGPDFSDLDQNEIAKMQKRVKKQ